MDVYIIVWINDYIVKGNGLTRSHYDFDFTPKASKQNGSPQKKRSNFCPFFNVITVLDSMPEITSTQIHLSKIFKAIPELGQDPRLDITLRALQRRKEFHWLTLGAVGSVVSKIAEKIGRDDHWIAEKICDVYPISSNYERWFVELKRSGLLKHLTPEAVLMDVYRLAILKPPKARSELTPDDIDAIARIACGGAE